ILISGATGFLAGVLYYIPVDKVADKLLVRYAKYGKCRYLRDSVCVIKEEISTPTKIIDYYTTVWRNRGWVVSDTSISNAIDSAIEDPSIQKEVWKLKNKSLVGLTIFAWSLILIPLILEQLQNVYLLFGLIIVGIGVLFGFIGLVYPWISKSAKKLPERIANTAVTHYGKDRFSRWKKTAEESNNPSAQIVSQNLRDDTKNMSEIISSGQWERFDLYYYDFLQFLDSAFKKPFFFDGRLWEIWSRAAVEIISIDDDESKKKIREKYLYVVKFLRTNDRISEITVKPADEEIDDLALFLERIGSNSRFMLFYTTFQEEVDLLLQQQKDNPDIRKIAKILFESELSKKLSSFLIRTAQKVYSG
ncbi:MAG: hypothetical protein ACW98U_15950, partial [Candidatus Thorarchaeota archaeon]